MSRWKYFTTEEVAGLKDELVSLLDEMRYHAGIPITITCGYRDPAHNASVGGVSDSAHTKGLAADIRAHDSNTKYLLTKGAMLAGFKRIEIATEHVHVDCDPTLPQNVLFLGVSH